MNDKFKIIILVGSGGFIGSVCRYLAGIYFHQKLFSVIPAGTLLVNITGCFIIGLLSGISEWTNIPDGMRNFLTAGFCGGFTTFSAFSVESYYMIKSEMHLFALLYIILSIVLGVLATFAGIILIRLFH